MKKSHVVILVLVGLGVAGALMLRQRRDEPAAAPAPETAMVTATAPKLVELGSTRCTSCKAMYEELAALGGECGASLAIEAIDVFKDEAKAAPYDVSVIPTQVFLDAEGREFDRHVGFLARAEIRKRFERVGLACP